MKRLLAVAAVAVMAASPGVAEAAPFTLQDGVTYTAVFDTTHSQGTGQCATLNSGCEATAEFTLDASAGTLTIELSNTSSDTINNQNLLTGLFFDSTPTLTGVTAQFSGGMSTWDLSFNQGSFEIVTSGNGAPEALDDGESGTVVISFSNTLTSLTIDDSQVHFQSLVGNTGQSDKLTCCEEGEEGEGEEGEGEEGEGETPEPASLLLLGSALTAAGFRLRRVRS